MRSLILLTALLAVAACGAADERPLAAAGQEATSIPVEASSVDESAADGVTVTVSLWHCGVEPVTLDGRVWEVPPSETVDGQPDLPLDATNTPPNWVGRGTAVVAEDEMTYTDDGGELVAFIPDDGLPFGPCA